MIFNKHHINILIYQIDFKKNFMTIKFLKKYHQHFIIEWKSSDQFLKINFLNWKYLIKNNYCNNYLKISLIKLIIYFQVYHLLFKDFKFFYL
jgi:hypothetical protein